MEVWMKRFAFALLLAFTCSSASAQSWGEYVNARFQYRLCYPQALFSPEAEADNGDGRRFDAPDGISLIVYGRRNAMDESVNDVAQGIGARLAGDSGRIVYVAAQPGFFVVSGTHAGQIFYVKGLLRGDDYKIFELVYPAAQRAQFDGIVTRMSGCFGNIGR
jgi:hypothetical protein